MCGGGDASSYKWRMTHLYALGNNQVKMNLAKEEIWPGHVILSKTASYNV